MDQENYNDIDMEIEMDSNDIDVSAEMPNEILVNNYNSLKNKPSINSVELVGNKTLEDLGITEYVEGEIANFDFIKIVPQLPEKGLINRTYFVPKTDPESNDLYEEYMWINNKWEMMGTKQIQVDLTAYVKNTDYAKPDKGGTIKIGNGVSLKNGVIQTDSIDYNAYKDSPNEYFIGKGTLEKVIEGKELINKEYSDNIVEEQRLENERLRNDIKSIAVVGEESGENIHIEDSSNARCEIEIGGNQKQETRSGKNLSKVEKISTVNGGYINASCGILAIVEKGETYTISLNCSSKYSGTNVINVRVFVEDSYYVQTNLNYSSGNRISRTFVASNSGELTLSANLGTDYTDVLYDIQLEKGTSATDYEQYGASPSIDYPSKVKSVNGSAKTDISNKNYLSKIPKKSITAQGITSTFDGEKFICKGTAQTNYFNLLTENVYKKIGKGIKTFSTNKLKKGRAFIHFGYVDGTGQNYYTNINTNQVSFTLNKDVKSYRLNVDSITAGDTIDDNIYVQLEDGNIATEIEKAENQEYLVDVQQPMFEGDTFVRQDGKWYEKHNFDVISTLNKSNIKVTKSSTSTDTFFRYLLSLNAVNRKEGIGLKIYSTHFINKNSRWARVEGICGWESGTTFCLGTFNAEYDTEEKVTNFLQNTDVKIYYELAEPAMLECTEAQSKVLDEIYNKAHTYKNITNISAESSEVNPIVNVKYLKDTEKYIENKITTALTEINALNQVRTQMLDAEVEI